MKKSVNMAKESQRGLSRIEAKNKLIADGWEEKTIGKWQYKEFVYQYVGSVDLSSSVVSANLGLDSYSGSVLGLLKANDDTFFPPLTYRKGSTGSGSVMNLKNLEEGAIEAYRETMLAQKNIFVLKENIVIAFMSFRHDYDAPHYFPQVIEQGDSVNYITTLIVNSDYRKNHIAYSLYAYIENLLPEMVHGRCVATRTWGKNEPHIKLLAKRNYKLTCRLPEERNFKDSTDDTVYFAKRVERVQEKDKLYL